ncbi:MAG: hypothetical protein FWE34_07475 [Defluviitaleaceae bacterium]|nr:hypothetical protein [Defluviitaleaceae bacterium]
MVTFTDYIIYLLATILAVIVVSFIITKLQSRKKVEGKFRDAFGNAPNNTDYELDSIKKYSEFKDAHNTNCLRVDKTTWNDLNMDNVFKRINACVTSIGEEYLYNCLHELHQDEKPLAQKEELIASFAHNPQARLRAQIALSTLGKQNYNSLPSLMFQSNYHILPFPPLYTIFGLMPLASALFLFINVHLGASLIFLAFAINLIIYYKTKFRVDSEMLNISYFVKLLGAGRRICALEELHGLPVVDDIRKNSLAFRKLTRRMSLRSGLGNADITGLTMYLDILFLIDMRQFNKFMLRIKKHHDKLHELYKAIGEIDNAICIASFRKSLPTCCLPTFSNDAGVKFSEVFHPLIPLAVTNSGTFSNHNLVTGSNASGKSTFIRALAVNGILAQTIHTCAAREFRTRFCLVATSMAVQDNLLGGESYFVAEIKSLERIMDYIQKYACACYIDEILRGTNTIERIAASAAALEHLHKQDCLCVIATHDIELTRILDDKFDNYHFSENIANESIEFNYKLNSGASTTRNAIKLLEFMGFDKSIVEYAEKIANKM